MSSRVTKLNQVRQAFMVSIKTPLEFYLELVNKGHLQAVADLAPKIQEHLTMFEGWLEKSILDEGENDCLHACKRTAQELVEKELVEKEHVEKEHAAKPTEEEEKPKV